MYQQTQTLRKKMERFNKWESDRRRELSMAKRLEQFIILFDLGMMYDEETRKHMNEEHQNAIVNAGSRFRNAASKKINLIKHFVQPH